MAIFVNKSQQDALLGAVEDGTLTLIGATTENPSFEVITPLLSRCQVFVLKSMEVKDLDALLERALTKDSVLSELDIEVREKDALFRFSGGDARKLLNLLEIIISSFGENEKITITDKLVSEILQKNIAIYDKNGEMHYDIISAFIKSLRGSDPNAAVYWMARMLVGGEDPLFIARRMMILASEDIGLANPNAMLLAQACFDAVHKIGMPEARIILSETAIYLATSPADHIIDLGPEGGDRGGTIVASGTPEEIAQVEDSYTGQFLKGILQTGKYVDIAELKQEGDAMMYDGNGSAESDQQN